MTEKEIRENNLINLKQALEINEESMMEDRKLMDRHKVFFDRERNRFIQIINEVDTIINNCDSQMQNTINELETKSK